MVDKTKVEAYLTREGEPKYPLEQIGTWRIMVGLRIGGDWFELPRKELELVEGRYIDVIDYALSLDDFHMIQGRSHEPTSHRGWGEIERVDVNELSLNQDLDDLL